MSDKSKRIKNSLLMSTTMPAGAAGGPNAWMMSNAHGGHGHVHGPHCNHGHDHDHDDDGHVHGPDCKHDH